MSVAARLNGRITQLAVGRHLPQRTVRVRLTLLYGELFLLSGAALMAITYSLLVNAGFVFTLQNTTGNVALVGPPARLAPTRPVGLPVAGSTTHPSAQTMAHWREVAQCMRRHGLPQFPNPTTSVPPKPAISVPSNGLRVGEVSDRDGAILILTAAVLRSPAFTRRAAHAGSCPTAPRQRLRTTAGARRHGNSC
jgi:hypothetical protein